MLTGKLFREPSSARSVAMADGAVPPRPAALGGRVAMIAGGASGLGAAMSRALFDAGASIVVLDIDVEAGRALTDELAARGGRAVFCRCDTRDQADVDAAIQCALRLDDRIDILINNVGGTVRKLFMEMAEHEWHEMLDVNLVQVFRCTRAVVNVMIEREIRGSIVNLTTIEAYRGAPGYAPYAAAKAGLVNFTKTLALELAPWGIRVNSIAPDATTTAWLARVLSPLEHERLDSMTGHIPRNRRGRPEDYAGAALYFASDMSDWVTGVDLHVDGGTFASSGFRRDDDGYWNNGGPPQAFSGRTLRESAPHRSD